MWWLGDIQGGVKVGFQLCVWEITEELINNNTRINCVLHTYNCTFIFTPPCMLRFFLKNLCGYPVAPGPFVETAILPALHFFCTLSTSGWACICRPIFWILYSAHWAMCLPFRQHHPVSTLTHILRFFCCRSTGPWDSADIFQFIWFFFQIG